MAYTVKGTILGFENTRNVEINKIDDLFLSMKDIDNENISFTLVNPALLRDYSFEVPIDVKALLEINEESVVSVYNIMIVQKPLEKSTVNFLAPIIVNRDNDSLAQAILEPSKYPDYGLTEPIEKFVQPK